jgi:hypothetical protein
MEAGDFFLVFIFLGLAALAGLIYLVKMRKAKKHLTLAGEAKLRGDDKTAIILFKKALNHANEKPDMEAEILLQLEALYANNGLKYDFSDLNQLLEQTRVLSKKSSNKALRELGKVLKLKKEIVDEMPELP